MITVAIVEDELNCTGALKGVLLQFAREEIIELKVDCYSNGLNFLDKFKSNYDVVFMDIELPKMNGFETAKKLRAIDEMCLIVFVTNVARYAIEGYSVGASDYVLKPVTYNSMKFRLKRIFAKIKPRGQEVIIRNKSSIFRVNTDQILYVESIAHKVIYHTENGDYEAWDTISKIEEMLPKASFARCNSGYLVNLHHVKKVEGQYVTVGETRLKISDNKKKPFTYALMDYINGVNNIP